MNSIVSYGIILLFLFILELMYFKIAEHFNIIDKPNERSSHSTIVPRGGGIIFTLSIIVWMIWRMLNGDFDAVNGSIPFMCGLLLISGVSFVDDIKSLPDSLRLVVQFVSVALMFISIGIMQWNMWWIVAVALVLYVGTSNIINFMDGINGITAGYALAILLPLLMLDIKGDTKEIAGFIDESYLIVAILGVLVFSIFNFRPKGKAKCFAGDVGSIGIAFIMLYAIGRLVILTGDITYLILLLVYYVDGGLTIIHRIMLHENLGVAHRKHAYQIMANELKIGHIKISLLYTVMQLIVSLGFIYLCPNTLLAHWIYAISAGLILAIAYIVFMWKYYHLHEEYLASLM